MVLNSFLSSRLLTKNISVGPVPVAKYACVCVLGIVSMRSGGKVVVFVGCVHKNLCVCLCVSVCVCVCQCVSVCVSV